MKPSLRFGTRLPIRIARYFLVGQRRVGLDPRHVFGRDVVGELARRRSSGWSAARSLLVIGLMMILSSSGSLLPALSLPHQSGFFSSVMWSSLTASVSTNGPVPALNALRVKSWARGVGDLLRDHHARPVDQQRQQRRKRRR